ncbi:TPA: 2-(1,2-epoxy-1,2-dihydrophenyl)acetyl-CoA isomerase PaaG [Providencia alcalifaciens]|uniref:2-(1,2-epoxy-1,2-dihydrophenyl)acetyl-CoA isomerase PaaG n=1 Tax=Providencia alcalifaciens TaxID=126385 RepID=UPI001CC7FC5E|nr:2-(1,2-epoxy-1,2-dihydrophenyl)acetyl-CoA isomerase PaaG [Providencia alcalifaciens]CAG9407215.1 1,2-epoxyphenylacetyl-CoA isomerase [Providencia alcalifaciens]
MINDTTLTEEMILTSLQDGVLTITLNRPERLNSFNDEMHRQLSAAIKIAEQDENVRCLVITGAGRGFCAGQDLNDRNVAVGSEAPDLGFSVETYYNPLIRRLTSLPKPIICAVNGVAAGAGAAIALAGDIVIAAKNASFIQSFCRLGLVPDSGGSWFLPQLVGRARAMGMAMLGDKISAEQALQWGMIWQVTDHDQLATTVNNLAKHLATQPTYGLGLIKKAIHSAATNTLDQQLDLERDLQRLGGRSHDYREGVDAFLNKREPTFQGK